MERIEYNLLGTWWRKILFHKLDYVINGIDKILKYAKVYGEAKKIYITAGELFPHFYNNQFFLDNMNNSAQKNKADIRVIFGPALYVDSYKFLRFSLQYDNVKLLNRNEREGSHFKIIEDINGDKFAFVDAPHGLLKDKRKTILFTNDDLKIISALEMEFEERYRASELIEKDNLVEKFKLKRKKEKKNKEWEYSGFIYRSNGSIDIAPDEKIEELRQKLYEA